MSARAFGAAAAASLLAAMVGTAAVGQPAAPGQIVFQSTRTGDSEVWIMAPDGRGQRNLTNAPATEEATPALSPDGEQVAFVRNRGSRFQLWIMNADGSRQRRLGAGTGSDLNPAWAPTGDRIAFATREHENWDVVVTTLTGERTRVTSDPAVEINVSWAPSGDQLVFDRIERGRSDLWVAPATGGRAAQLTRTPRISELNPAWSPDGGEIAYGASVRGAYDLFALNVVTRRARHLTHDAADDGAPAWKPDGTALAFRRGAGPDYEIAIVSATGDDRPRNISRVRRGLDLAPSWSVATTETAPPVEATPLPAVNVPLFICSEAWPGTSGPDDYYGTPNANFMCGKRGKDTIRGFAKSDRVNGGRWKDVLRGGDGDDWLKAREDPPASDSVYGGNGTDHAVLGGEDSTNSVEDPQT